MPKVTLSGRPADPNYVGVTPQPPNAEGLCSDYWVLPEEERSNGYVRPVRLAYRHDRCGKATRMHVAIAETLARSPSFYSHMFCAFCNNHYPSGPQGEFTWNGSTERVGT